MNTNFNSNGNNSTWNNTSTTPGFGNTNQPNTGSGTFPNQGFGNNNNNSVATGFGGSTIQQPSNSLNNNFGNANTNAFGFGTSGTNVSGFDANKPPATIGMNSNFGNSNTAGSNAPSSFGNSNTTSGFGNNFSTTPSNTFGVGNTQPQGFGNTNSTPTNTGFGNTNSTPTNTGFGNTNSTPSNTGFGNTNSTPSNTGFGNTNSTPSNTGFGNTNPISTNAGFGNLNTSPTNTGFGNTNTLNSTPSFGNANTLNSTPGFGNTNTLNSTPGFGNTNTFNSTPGFGNKPNTGFGQTQLSQPVNRFTGQAPSSNNNVSTMYSKFSGFEKVNPDTSIPSPSFVYRPESVFDTLKNNQGTEKYSRDNPLHKYDFMFAIGHGLQLKFSEINPLGHKKLSEVDARLSDMIKQIDESVKKSFEDSQKLKRSTAEVSNQISDKIHPITNNTIMQGKKLFVMIEKMFAKITNINLDLEKSKKHLRSFEDLGSRVKNGGRAIWDSPSTFLQEQLSILGKRLSELKDEVTSLTNQLNYEDQTDEEFLTVFCSSIEELFVGIKILTQRFETLANDINTAREKYFGFRSDNQDSLSDPSTLVRLNKLLTKINHE